MEEMTKKVISWFGRGAGWICCAGAIGGTVGFAYFVGTKTGEAALRAAAADEIQARQDQALEYYHDLSRTIEDLKMRADALEAAAKLKRLDEQRIEKATPSYQPTPKSSQTTRIRPLGTQTHRSYTFKDAATGENVYLDDAIRDEWKPQLEQYVHEYEQNLKKPSPLQK